MDSLLAGLGGGSKGLSPSLLLMDSAKTSPSTITNAGYEPCVDGKGRRMNLAPHVCFHCFQIFCKLRGGGVSLTSGKNLSIIVGPFCGSGYQQISPHRNIRYINTYYNLKKNREIKLYK